MEKTILPDHELQHPPHARSHNPGWTRRCPHLEAAAVGLDPALGSETPSRNRITLCGAHRLQGATINKLMDLTLHPCSSVLVRSAEVRRIPRLAIRSKQPTHRQPSCVSLQPTIDIQSPSGKCRGQFWTQSLEQYRPSHKQVSLRQKVHARIQGQLHLGGIFLLMMRTMQIL